MSSSLPSPPPSTRASPTPRAPERPTAVTADDVRRNLAGVSDPVALLSGLVADAPFGVQLFDATGHSVFTNRAFREIFGSEPPPSYSVLEDEIAAARGVLGLVRRAFAGHVVRTPAFWYDARELTQVRVVEGRRVAVICTCVPLRVAGGAPTHVAMLFEDVTELMLARERAESERDRARAATEELRHQKDLRGLLLAALSDVGEALLISESSRVTFVNEALCRLTGYDSSELLSMDLWQLLPPELRDGERERVARIGGGAGSERYETTIVQKGGPRIDVEVVLQSLVDPRRVVAVAHDVTERKRGEARLRFLAGASAVLGTSLDYASTLQQVARLGIPEFADYGFIDVDEDGRNRRVALHRDPSKQPLVDTIHGLDWPDEHPAGRAWRTGEPVLVQELSDADYVAMGNDPDHLAVIRALSPKSILVVPLTARERPLGVCFWAVSESGRRFDRSDLDIAQEVARRSALAIDNARLYREAKDAVRTRDEFVSIASHELRTPLTGLRLQVQSMLKRARQHEPAPIAPDAIARALGTMERQTDRLARLLDNLLDVSRIAAGKLEIAREELDLAELVNDVVDRFDPQLTAARTSVVVEADEPVIGRWDRLRIEQVVTNLLSNALKYAPGQPIEIGVSATHDRARLVVRDHGPGIAREHLAHLFDRFERGAAVRSTPGLGLGLYITRQIVRAHGGEIRVESTAGEGTTFTVDLPRA